MPLRIAKKRRSRPFKLWIKDPTCIFVLGSRQAEWHSPRAEGVFRLCSEDLILASLRAAYFRLRLTHHLLGFKDEI